MRTLLLYALLLLPAFADAAPKLTESKAVQATVIEATTHLKQELTRELKQSTGIEEFVLKVELLIDEKKLQKTLGVNQEDWSKLQDLSLPGLFVEGKEAYSDSTLRQAKKEDILLSLRGAKINLVYYQANYTSEFLISALKKIVLFNVTSLLPSQIEIVPQLDPAPFRVGETTKPVSVNLLSAPDKPVSVSLLPDAARPFKVNVLPGEFQNFWDKNHKLILLCSGILLLALCFLITTSLKGGLRNLSEVIKTKTFSVAGGSRNDGALKKESQSQTHSGSSDTFKSYIEATEYLTLMVAKEPKVFNEVIVLKLMAEDFTALTILLDVLPKEKCQSFLANIEPSKGDRFKQFIVARGTTVLRDEGLLKDEAVKLIKLVKVASLSPEDLYQIVISDLVTSLQGPELEALLKVASANEKSYLCDQLSSPQLALLVQAGVVSPEVLEAESSPLLKSELIDLLIKASGTRGQSRQHVRKEKLESVYAQVEAEKAEILADAMGLPPELRFEYLFTSFKGSALKYLESMEYEGLALLYPLLTENMRIEVSAALPELLAERLQLSRKKINSESLGLKGDFYFYLRSLSAHDEPAQPKLKLAA